jgi:hypothetical protein
VAINNPDEIRNAFLEIRGPESGPVADSFIALLNDGMASLEYAGEQVDIPWRALAHGPTLAALNPELWAQLGVMPGATVESVNEAFAAFPTRPEYLMQNDMIGDLIDWGTRPEPGVMMLPIGGRIDRDPVEPLPDAGEAPNRRPPGQVITRVVNLAQAAADCLQNGEWSIERVGPFGALAVGPKVCLSRECADTLETALWGDAGGAILQILAAQTAPAALAAAGGWWGLALLHFSLHWAILISTNKTANGVCLIHFFPWISPVFGGILNGYAVGR